MVALALVVVFVFAGALSGRGVFFQRDIHWVWYPQVESMVHAVAEGAWPLWNPHAGFGAPALADPSYQIAYPLTWLNLVLPPSTYYKLFVVLHTSGAGLGLYFLGRRWGLRPLAAFVAGSSWMASGPLLSCVSLYHHFAGLAWMPWVLLALDVALDRASFASAVALGAVAAGQVLAGSGDMCLMSGLLGAVRIALFLLARARPRLRAAFGVARTCAVATLATLTISAVQWLPTVAILRSGSRLALDPRTIAYWSLHPGSLADMLVPGLISDFPMSDALREALYQSREPFLASLYLGMGVWLLAVLGVLVGDRRLGGPAFAAGLFLLLCALGRNTPLHGLLLIPPFRLFRYPVKYMIPASLLCALLAGVGMEAWVRPWSERQRLRASRLAAAVFGIALSAFALGEWVRLCPEDLRGLVYADMAPLEPTTAKLRAAAGLAVVFSLLLRVRARQATSRWWLSAAAALLAVGDLASAGRGVNVLVPPELAAYRPGWMAELGPDPSPHRLCVIPALPTMRERRSALWAPSGWTRDWAWTLGMQEMLAPPIGGRWGLDGSYDGDLTGLAPPALGVLSEALARARGAPLALRLLQMGSVDHVVSLEELPWLGREVARVSSVFPAPIRLYRVPDSLPRTYVVEGARAVGEPQSYVVLSDPDFDPRREVILAGGSSRAPHAGFSGASRVLWRRADALAIEANLSGFGYIVVVDAFHPGWRATVDGAPAETLRANILFRAVALPAGRHVVEMRYGPRSALWGGLLSAGGVLASLALAIRHQWRSSVPPPVGRCGGALSERSAT